MTNPNWSLLVLADFSGSLVGCFALCIVSLAAIEDGGKKEMGAIEGIAYYRQSDATESSAYEHDLWIGCVEDDSAAGLSSRFVMYMETGEFASEESSSKGSIKRRIAFEEIKKIGMRVVGFGKDHFHCFGWISASFVTLVLILISSVYAVMFFFAAFEHVQKGSMSLDGSASYLSELNCIALLAGVACLIAVVLSFAFSRTQRALLKYAAWGLLVVGVVGFVCYAGHGLFQLFRQAAQASIVLGWTMFIVVCWFLFYSGVRTLDVSRARATTVELMTMLSLSVAIGATLAGILSDWGMIAMEDVFRSLLILIGA